MNWREQWCWLLAFARNPAVPVAYRIAAINECGRIRKRCGVERKALLARSAAQLLWFLGLRTEGAARQERHGTIVLYRPAMMTETEEQFTARCEEHAASIFVRAEKDGRTVTRPLSELTPEQRRQWISEWWALGENRR